jgi:RNase P subunit RPR2
MAIEPEDGVWYIVVTCKHCSSLLYLFRDLTEGQGSLSATYSVTCPLCRQKGEYEARHHKHAEIS